MRRRQFIAGLGSVAAWPVRARAQQARTAKIGHLITGSLESPDTRVSIDALRRGLSELGYVEGQNIIIERRSADARIERLPALAAELVDLKVDVIVAAATPAGRAAQEATGTIPIIVSAMGDPVQDGLVASLSSPGANVTGTTFLGPELVPKRFALLKELLPTVSRIGTLWHPGAFSERTTQAMLSEAAAAKALSLQLQLLEARRPDDLGDAFTAMTRERAEALFTLPSTMFFNERQRLIDLAAGHRLPAMFNAREFVQQGGLIAYGANLTAITQRAATYVDKILKGAKPADLPVEQPSVFELAINLKTARMLGLDVPLFLQQRADEVIE